MNLLEWGVPRKEGSSARWATTLFGRDDLMAWTEAQPNTYEIDFINPYEPIEYTLGMRCKDTQLAEATNHVIRSFIAAVEMYRLGAGGDKVPFIWRIKPDMDTWFGEVAEYREDGPDVDSRTDKRCVIDKSIAFVKVRARFMADNMPAGTIAPRSVNKAVPPGWEALPRAQRDIDDNVVMIRKL